MSEESLLSGAGEGSAEPASQQTGSAEGGSPGEGNQNTQSPQWHMQFTKQARENELSGRLEDFKNVTDLAVTAFSWKDELEDYKANGVKKPGKDASEQEIHEYKQKMGFPLSSDEIEFGEIAGLENDKEVLESFKSVAFQAGLTKDQANEVAKFLGKTNSQAMEQLEKAVKDQKDTNEGKLRSQWKDDYKQNMLDIKTMSTKFGGDDILKFFDQSGFGNEPVFISFLHEISKHFADPAFDSGLPGAGKQTEGLSFPNTTYTHLKEA